MDASAMRHRGVPDVRLWGEPLKRTMGDMAYRCLKSLRSNRPTTPREKPIEEKGAE